MSSRLLVVSMTIILLLAAGGCASSGSTSTARSRTVARGDTVVFRLPASFRTGPPEWRISEWDSRKLSLTGRTAVDTTADPPEWVFQLIARNTGQTEVEFTRTRAAPGAEGAVGDRQRFRVRVR
jgi:hypothetical protein